MKRTQPSACWIAAVEAPLSQANVSGAEQACTAIAVVACAHYLVASAVERARPPVAERLEFLIRQGGALYGRLPSTHAYLHAKEVVDYVSPALPIGCGPEHGGALWDDADAAEGIVPLSAALADMGDDDTAVLTCGALSLALLGSHDIFDSHALDEFDNHAAWMRFVSRASMLAYLHERFPDPRMTYSLCVVRTRPPRPPTTYPRQELAFAAADQVMFLHVFARDRNASGSKEYQVAGLRDFFHYYRALAPAQRNHYDIARDMQPVAFYADPEFEHAHNADCAGRDMLRTLQQLVLDEWNASFPSARIDGDDAFFVTDSSDTTKCSFHVHHHGMEFRDYRPLASFMERVVRRGQQLLVWRPTWNAKERRRAMEQHFFADLSVYTPNRCFRACYSTKWSAGRHFRPLKEEDDGADDDDDITWESFCGSLIISPDSMLPYMPAESPQPAAAPASAPAPAGGGGIIPMSQCPPPLSDLAAEVERHFRPEQMRGFQVAPLGLVTFSMVNHRCTICNDMHNNQTYVVADLKRRVYFQKCHVDRTRTGPEVAFTAALGPLALVHASELDAASGTFPAASSAARLVLAFARAIYASARTAPQIPTPGTAAVRFVRGATYDVPLAGLCEVDSGQQVLVVTRDKVKICCRGSRCPSLGKRWERPSRSSTAVGQWNLSFLFPPPSSIVEAAAVGAPASSQAVFAPDAFLDEPNFLHALGLRDLEYGAAKTLYKTRIDLVVQWAASIAAADAVMAKRVRDKASVVSRVLLDPKGMLEVCYRECLRVAPDFCYPVQLLPKDAATLATALWIHLARSRGYKRVADDFYVPTTDERGRVYYRAVPLKQLLTSVCSFDAAPNLCTQVLWNRRVLENVEHMLQDENEFPSLPLSKRYLGFANVVYDLESNVAIEWDAVRADPSVMPFNFLDQPFPVDELQRARRVCPDVRIVRDDESGEKRIDFVSRGDFIRTPLFDALVEDQCFSPAAAMWLYALLGRMFHNAGKTAQGGDNWEVILFLIGAPGTGKSSVVSTVHSYLQPSQVGIIATRVETMFPIASLVGRLMAFMTECGGCTLERDLLKQMASGDPVTVSTKHRTGQQVPHWTTPCLFAGNSMLDVRDTDGSLERRAAVFAFTRLLRPGQSRTDLVERIAADEGPLLLIKCNTLYLAMKSAVRESVHDLLPAEIREATHQALAEKDPLRSFVDQQCMATGITTDRVLWSVFWATYQQWCKTTGKTPYAADPYTVEIQTMLRRIGVRLSRSRAVPPTLVGLRPRGPGDRPYRSVFEVHRVARHRVSGDEGDADEESSSSSSGSGNEREE